MIITQKGDQLLSQISCREEWGKICTVVGRNSGRLCPWHRKCPPGI